MAMHARTNVMSTPAFEALKLRARIGVGACLHATGLYRRLLPVYLRQPSEPMRRLQSYLAHYYQSVEHAEARLYLDGLGLEVACDIKDHMLWDYLEGLKPIYEQTEIDHCRTHVRPGDHILDVGANHGFWGFALARAASNTRLYLAEPNPTILSRLRKTASINPTIDAHILPWAITDGGASEVTFYLPTGNLSGLGSTVLHASAKRNGYLEEERRTQVAARSLDQLMDVGAIARIDVMKIDVEQGEDAVIRGGFQAIAQFRPRLIMIETSPESFAARTVAKLGYSTYCLDQSGVRQPVPPGYWGNIFFATERAS
jgi:FkbM family methyltransferase